jgi:hypothetical protein
MLHVINRVFRAGQPGFPDEPSGSNVNTGQRMKESKDIQQPQNHGDDYNAVEN